MRYNYRDSESCKTCRFHRPYNPDTDESIGKGKPAAWCIVQQNVIKFCMLCNVWTKNEREEIDV